MKGGVRKMGKNSTCEERDRGKVRAGSGGHACVYWVQGGVCKRVKSSSRRERGGGKGWSEIRRRVHAEVLVRKWLKQRTCVVGQQGGWADAVRVSEEEQLKERASLKISMQLMPCRREESAVRAPPRGQCTQSSGRSVVDLLCRQTPGNSSKGDQAEHAQHDAAC